MSNRRFYLLLLASLSISGFGIWSGISYLSQNPLPWPGKTVTYYDQSIWKQSVKAAVRKFNSTGLGIKLKEVKDPDQADIRIVSNQKSHSSCGKNSVACATLVGYLPIPFYQPKIVLPSPERPEGMDTIERIITHEFGHILGLKHQKEPCSVMAKSTIRIHCPVFQQVERVDPRYTGCDYQDETIKCKSLHHQSYWCGLQEYDLRLLQGKYGGKLNPHYKSSCRRKMLIVSHRELKWPFSPTG